MKHWTRLGLAIMALIVGLWAADAVGQSPLDAARQHCAAAKAAAGQEYAVLLNQFPSICGDAALSGQPAAAPERGRGAGAGRGGRGAPQTPERDAWYAEPRKVFDNLYFVGTKDHSSWVVSTSEGLIVIEALFEYAVRDSVVEGLRKLGLNPATMKYLIVSHGHADHHGGAKFLQDEFGPRVIFGAPDWDLIEKDTRNPAPKRDILATDGQKITLGDTTVTVYLTPGHTDGTLSLIIPVKDNGKPHLLATWGGTLISPNTPADALKKYVESAVRHRALATKLGVEGILSNHTIYDGTALKLPVLANRKPGDPHPYLTGTESVRRYLTAVEEVGRAALALREVRP